MAEHPKESCGGKRYEIISTISLNMIMIFFIVVPQMEEEEEGRPECGIAEF